MYRVSYPEPEKRKWHLLVSAIVTTLPHGNSAAIITTRSVNLLSFLVVSAEGDSIEH